MSCSQQLKKAEYPLIYAFSDSIKFQLVEEALVWYFIESLAVVQKHDISHPAFFKGGVEVVGGGDQLAHSGPVFSEAVLRVGQHFLLVKMIHDVRSRNMFKAF